VIKGQMGEITAKQKRRMLKFMRARWERWRSPELIAACGCGPCRNERAPRYLIYHDTKIALDNAAILSEDRHDYDYAFDLV
jgi:hypothetical protein